MTQSLTRISWKIRLKTLCWWPILVGSIMVVGGLVALVFAGFLIVYPFLCILGKVAMKEDGSPILVQTLDKNVRTY